MSYLVAVEPRAAYSASTTLVPRTLIVSVSVRGLMLVALCMLTLLIGLQSFFVCVCVWD